MLSFCLSSFCFGIFLCSKPGINSFLIVSCIDQYWSYHNMLRISAHLELTCLITIETTFKISKHSYRTGLQVFPIRSISWVQYMQPPGKIGPWDATSCHLLLSGFIVIRLDKWETWLMEYEILLYINCVSKLGKISLTLCLLA